MLEPARGSLLAWLERRGGALEDFAFPSRIAHSDHLGTRQYARLVDEGVSGIGLRSDDYGTHSLRRTKASIIYKQTGNLRAVQILLGHTKIESTVRYLGVDIEDALALAERAPKSRLPRNVRCSCLRAGAATTGMRRPRKGHECPLWVESGRGRARRSLKLHNWKLRPHPIERR